MYVGGHEGHKDNVLRKTVFTTAIEEAKALDPAIEACYLHAGFTEYSGMQALEAYIKDNADRIPDVIVCANDTTAIGVQKVLRVQDNPHWHACAVTGFDDIIEAGDDGAKLTTVRQPLSLLGVFAAESMYKMLTKERVEDVVKISSSLIIRQSCGCSAPQKEILRSGLQSSQGKLERYISKIQHSRIRTELLERYVSHFGRMLSQADTIESVVSLLQAFLASMEIQDFYLLLFDDVDLLPQTASLLYQKEAGIARFYEKGEEVSLKAFFASVRFSSNGNSSRSVLYYFMSGQKRLGMMVYKDDPMIHSQMCNCGIFLSGAFARIRTLEKEKHANQILEAEVQKRTRELLQTNRKLVEEAEKRMQVEAQVLKIGELERKRFSMDLHDDICQRLAGISMICAGLASENEKLLELSGLIDETLRRTRQYAHDSFPMELNSLGLEKAIGTLCDTVQRQSYGKTKVTYRWELQGEAVPGDERIQCEINIFRIIQEALNNSLRHAKASQIDVRITETGDGMQLVIQDNGEGNPDISFPPADGAGEGSVQLGVGLQSMHYRADQLGADFRIVSSRDGGTSVILHWNKGAD